MSWEFWFFQMISSTLRKSRPRQEDCCFRSRILYHGWRFWYHLFSVPITLIVSHDKVDHIFRWYSCEFFLYCLYISWIRFHSMVNFYRDDLKLSFWRIIRPIGLQFSLSTLLDVLCILAIWLSICILMSIPFGEDRYLSCLSF